MYEHGNDSPFYTAVEKHASRVAAAERNAAAYM